MATGTETRIKVFVSYSRTDKVFANELVLGLAACGFAPYIDRQDIAAGEDWEKRLAGLISEADSIVYIVSPDSLASENCAQEFRQALELRKRILPVVWRAIDDSAAPPEMKRLNYIFFSGEGRTFATGLSELATALRTDIDWIREHTRLSEQAGRWAGRGRGADLLLRGEDIDAALVWSAGKPITAPPITDDQADFIKASADARAEAQRRARRARAGLLTAVSAAAVVFAVLAGLAGWQWTVARDGEARVSKAYGELEAATQVVRESNLRLGAEVWLRTAPSDTGYYVVDSGWYPVVSNYSGAIARMIRSTGDGRLLTSTAFIIDGGLVHQDHAGEALLLAQADTSIPECEPPDPSDTLAPEACQQTQMSSSDTPNDTLSPEEESRVQRVLTSDGPKDGVEQILVTFPALTPKGQDAPPPIKAIERIWRTPEHLGGEFPFEIWKLAEKPPFGARSIVQADIDCTPFDAPADDTTVAMLGVGVKALDGPSERALAINISELLNRSEAQNILYTHANNRISAGSPVFDLRTGGILAVHVGSEPDPDREDRRRGYGYSLRHLLDIARGTMRGAELPPVCGG